MSVISYDDLLDEDGVHADPYAIARLTRSLLSANSGGVASSLLVKPTSGLLFGFTVSSSNGAAQFIQLFDRATLPADTAVPTVVFKVSATDVLPMQFLPPRSFRNGIVICNSSTQHTKTIGSADCIFDVQYL